MGRPKRRRPLGSGVRPGVVGDRGVPEPLPVFPRPVHSGSHGCLHHYALEPAYSFPGPESFRLVLLCRLGLRSPVSHHR